MFGPTVLQKNVSLVMTFVINQTFLADHYLLDNHREPGKLYCESYQNVAVVFASVPDFMDSFKDQLDLQAGMQCLKTLNEIIRGLDRVRILHKRSFE